MDRGFIFGFIMVYELAFVVCVPVEMIVDLLLYWATAVVCCLIWCGLIYLAHLASENDAIFNVTLQCVGLKWGGLTAPIYGIEK